MTAQSEYSTDILFRKRADLEELMPQLCQYRALYFSASNMMSFLGRKLTGHFQGEVVTDQREVEVPGTRVPGDLWQHLREKRRIYEGRICAPSAASRWPRTNTASW